MNLKAVLALLLLVLSLGCQQEVATAGKNKHAPPRRPSADEKAHSKDQVEEAAEQRSADPAAGDEDGELREAKSDEDDEESTDRTD